ASQDELVDLVRAVGSLLPSQGPLSVFVHHNPLHAFEDASFEDATAAASAMFGCEPYWPEDRYREAFGTGRLADDDLTTTITDYLGASSGDILADGVKRSD